MTLLRQQSSAIKLDGHVQKMRAGTSSEVNCKVSLQRDELETKYQRVSAEEVEEGWKRVHEFSAVACMHGDNCSVGDACQVLVPTHCNVCMSCVTRM